MQHGGNVADQPCEESFSKLDFWSPYNIQDTKILWWSFTSAIIKEISYTLAKINHTQTRERGRERERDGRYTENLQRR